MTEAVLLSPNASRPSFGPTEGVHDTRLNALPPAAREKFERLRRTELRARALVDGLVDEMERVRERCDAALRALSFFDAHHKPEGAYTVVEDPKTGGRIRVPTVFPEREALVQKIAGCKAELQRLSQEQAAANPGFSTGNIIRWVAEQSSKFVAAPVPLIKVAKGETYLDALARNREAQAARRDELTAAHNARRTIAEVKDAMRAAVARAAEKGRPDVSNLFRGGEITWPTETLVATGSAVVSATVKDALAVAVWANEEAIVKRLDTEIERRGDDAIALSREAQAARVAECERALLDLQRQEEAIIERLEAQGHFVLRLCTEPIVLLGIEMAQ